MWAYICKRRCVSRLMSGKSESVVLSPAQSPVQNWSRWMVSSSFRQSVLNPRGIHMRWKCKRTILIMRCSLPSFMFTGNVANCYCVRNRLLCKHAWINGSCIRDRAPWTRVLPPPRFSIVKFKATIASPPYINTHVPGVRFASAHTALSLNLK